MRIAAMTLLYAPGLVLSERAGGAIRGACYDMVLALETCSRDTLILCHAADTIANAPILCAALNCTAFGAREETSNARRSPQRWKARRALNVSRFRCETTSRPLQPARSAPALLIVACALVFFFELSLDGYSRDYFINLYGIVPAHLRPVTIFTSMFSHAGWVHIIGNMIFLWAFGKSLEDAMGHTKFLVFYLICGVAAGVTHVALNLYTTLPTVGASGAIAGVMGAYLIKFPRAKIHTLFIIRCITFPVEIPAFVILIYWFLTQLLNEYGSITTTQVANGGVAYAAHIGGFVTGMVLVQFMGVRSRYLARRDIYW